MLALYRSGRQAEALQVYALARRLLTEELGVDPSPELEQMQRAILEHDVAIQAPSDVPVAQAPRDDGSVERAPRLGSNEEVGSDFRATRRTVTVLVVETEAADHGPGSDPESSWRRLPDAPNVIATAARRHGGSVEAAVGEATIAVFGLERSHEDDAAQAVDAAWELHTALNFGVAAGDPTATRIGVATGESVITLDLAPAPPASVVTAATRLARRAAPATILVDFATRELIGAAYELEALGGDAEAASGRSPAYRLLQPSAASTHGLRLETALIGRDRELAMLGESLTRAMHEQSCLLFSLIAPAGTGKSRLIHEFVAAIRPSAMVLRGRCRPHGQVAAFEPVAEVLRQAAHATSREAPADLPGWIRLMLADEPQAMVADHAAAARKSARPSAASSPDRLKNRAAASAGEGALAAGQLGRAVSRFRRAAACASRANDPLGESIDRIHIATCELGGPTPVRVVRATADDLLSWAQSNGQRGTEAVGLALRARVDALEGRFDVARALLGAAMAINIDLGRRLHVAADHPRWIAFVEEAAGDLAAAEAGLRHGIEQIEALGERVYLIHLRQELGRVLALQGRFADARGFIQATDDRMQEESIRVNWKATRALILAGHGDRDRSLALAGEAEADALRTDALLLQGRATEDRARVLEKAGRLAEAAAAWRRAAAIYRRKGAIALADRASSLASDDADGSGSTLPTASGSSARRSRSSRSASPSAPPR